MIGKGFTFKEKIDILISFEELPADLPVKERHRRIEEKLGYTFSSWTLLKIRRDRSRLLKRKKNIQKKIRGKLDNNAHFPKFMEIFDIVLKKDLIKGLF